jgi:hypothetical protein
MIVMMGRFSPNRMCWVVQDIDVVSPELLANFGSIRRREPFPPLRPDNRFLSVIRIENIDSRSEIEAKMVFEKVASELVNEPICWDHSTKVEWSVEIPSLDTFPRIFLSRPKERVSHVFRELVQPDNLRDRSSSTSPHVRWTCQTGMASSRTPLSMSSLIS